MKITSNSQEVNFHKGKVNEHKKRDEELDAEIKKLQAQKTANLLQLSEEENMAKDGMAEADQLKTSFQELKDCRHTLEVVFANEPKHRFLGANNSDGCVSYLRQAFGLYSSGDTNVPLKLLRGFLAFAILVGMETNPKWVGYWTAPPDEMTLSQWQELVGKKPGHIHCNNSLDKDHVRTILYYLLDLSPVKSPSPEKKAGYFTPGPSATRTHRASFFSPEPAASGSHQRSRSAKKGRLSVDERAHMNQLMEYFTRLQEASDSDSIAGSDSITGEED